MRALLDEARRWRSFVGWFTATFALGLGGAFAAILIVDPLGLFPWTRQLDRPLMDYHQRYMYPQVIRSGRFDSLVIGTSTGRLVDPQVLGRHFGGRFANLAMDDSRAWEQAEIARLFLRVAGRPRTFVVALDSVWCSQSADRDRITFRGFPEWLYDDDLIADLPYMFNSRLVRATAQTVAWHLGFLGPFLRSDGFGRFTPPEDTYDAAQARRHIDAVRTPQATQPRVPPVELDEARRAEFAFPALDWLSALLHNMPGTRIMFAWMPVHVAAQEQPGSLSAVHGAECKARVDALARRHGALVIDMRIPSAVTREDTNYWDPLHYRMHVAARIEAALDKAWHAGQVDDDGFFVLRVDRPRGN